MIEKINTIDPFKRRPVKAGEYDSETKTFTKTANRKKHFFRLLGGYGIQKDIMDALETKGAQFVKVVEEDTGHVLLSRFSDWASKGNTFTGKNGKQCILAEDFFEVVN